MTVFVLDPSVVASLELLLSQGGIDWTIVGETFGAGLFLWAVGAGVGLSINVLRKFR